LFGRCEAVIASVADEDPALFILDIQLLKQTTSDFARPW
jgi:hypothetical protein